MKRGFYILLIMCTAIMVVSCDKTKSYTDMLKAQEKAIDRLRADSGLVFLEEFPTDSIFKENEFVGTGTNGDPFPFHRPDVYGKQ